LDAALQAARAARSLLDPALLQHAEELLVGAGASALGHVPQAPSLPRGGRSSPRQLLPLLQVNTRAQEEKARWRSLAHGLSWDRNDGAAATAAVASALAATAAAAAAAPGASQHPAPQPAQQRQQQLRMMSAGSLQHLAALEAAMQGVQHIDEESECVVCLSAVKNTACVPCGHVCMCSACAGDVQQASGQCPVCRADMDMVIQIAD
jgi:hypothetical protein